MSSCAPFCLVSSGAGPSYKWYQFTVDTDKLRLMKASGGSTRKDKTLIYQAKSLPALLSLATCMKKSKLLSGYTISKSKSWEDADVVVACGDDDESDEDEENRGRTRLETGAKKREKMTDTLRVKDDSGDEDWDGDKKKKTRKRSPSPAVSRKRSPSPAISRKRTRARDDDEDDDDDDTHTGSGPIDKSKRSKVLQGLRIVISGALSMVRREYEKMLGRHGAFTASTISSRTTHVLSTENEVIYKHTSKTMKAQDLGIPIVSEEWIDACLEAGKIVDHKKYIIAKDDADGDDDDDDEKSSPAPKKRRIEEEPPRKRDRSPSPIPRSPSPTADEMEDIDDVESDEKESKYTTTTTDVENQTSRATVATIKKPKNEWKCKACTFSNTKSAHRLKCEMCSASRISAGTYPFGLKWVHGGDGLIYLDSDAIPGSKMIVGFDMDHTLIQPKSAAKFPKDRKDWTWWDDCVPDKLRELYLAGYKIFIFSNQGGIAAGKQKEADVTGKILDMIKVLGFPIQAFLASEDNQWRKPATLMWDHAIKECNGGVKPDLNHCMYVGDAAGRPAAWKPSAARDFSCTDRAFAHNIGIGFATESEFFLGMAPAKFMWRETSGADIVQQAIAKAKKYGVSDWKTSSGWRPTNKSDIVSKKQELIVNCGFPGSGKSTFSKKYLVPKGYVWVNRDTLGTKERCIAEARKALEAGKSVVIDNTNPEVETRKLYLKLAKEAGVPARCFYFTCERHVAEFLNSYREKISKGEHRRVPRISFNIFQSRRRIPDVSEGFTEVCHIDFIPKFETDAEERLFLQRTG